MEADVGMAAAPLLPLVVALFEVFLDGDDAARLVGGAEATEVSVETLAGLAGH